MKKHPPCEVCGHAGTDSRPAGRNNAWECSHVDCPNRRGETARPSDGLAYDIDGTFTYHKTLSDQAS